MKRLTLLLILMALLCVGFTKEYSHLELLQTFKDVQTHSAQTKEGDFYNVLEISPKLELVKKGEKSYGYQYIGESNPDQKGFRVTFFDFVFKCKPASYREDMEKIFSKLKKPGNKRLVGINGLGANISSVTFITEYDSYRKKAIFTYIKAYKEVDDGVLEILLLANDDILSQELYDQIQTMDHPFVKAFNQRVLDSVTFFPED